VAISNRMSKMDYSKIATKFDRNSSDLKSSARDGQSKASMLSPSGLDFALRSGLQSDRTISGQEELSKRVTSAQPSFRRSTD
jgi:hypothetical protein